MVINPVLLKQKELADNKSYRNIVVEQIGNLYRFHEWATDCDETEIFFDDKEEAIAHFHEYVAWLEDEE